MHAPEIHVIAKSAAAPSEDAAGVSADFAWVVDGATAKRAERWDGKTPGKLAAELIEASVQGLPRDATVEEAARDLTACLDAEYGRRGCRERVARDPGARLTASVGIYSFARRQVWLLGDCQALFAGGEPPFEVVFANERRIDRVVAAARAAFLSAELAAGRATVDELRARDVGRALVLPLLERQAWFQNAASGELAFPVVDGFPITPRAVEVASPPAGTTTLVLASDGYPRLCSTFEASERYLAELIARDPLMIGEHKATKGVGPGASSYDDRAYVRLSLLATAWGSETPPDGASPHGPVGNRTD